MGLCNFFCIFALKVVKSIHYYINKSDEKTLLIADIVGRYVLLRSR